MKEKGYSMGRVVVTSNKWSKTDRDIERETEMERDRPLPFLEAEFISMEN